MERKFRKRMSSITQYYIVIEEHKFQKHIHEVTVYNYKDIYIFKIYQMYWWCQRVCEFGREWEESPEREKDVK